MLWGADVTGIVSAVLTCFGVILLMAGVIAGMALADAPSAVAAAAGLCTAGLAGVSLSLIHI